MTSDSCWGGRGEGERGGRRGREREEGGEGGRERLYIEGESTGSKEKERKGQVGLINISKLELTLCLLDHIIIAHNIAFTLSLTHSKLHYEQATAKPLKKDTWFHPILIRDTSE